MRRCQPSHALAFAAANLLVLIATGSGIGVGCQSRALCAGDSCSADQVCVASGGVTSCVPSCTASRQCIGASVCCQPLTDPDAATFNGAGACLAMSGDSNGQCLCQETFECASGTCTSHGGYSTCEEGSDSGLDSGDVTPDGGVVTPPSCTPGGPGLSNCGAGGSGNESCCTSLEVTGGTYYRTYTN